jgi:hypothetical protein
MLRCFAFFCTLVLSANLLYSQQSTLKRFLYDGKIGKSVKAAVWITEQRGMVRGEIRYSTSKSAIALGGTKDLNGYLLYEFSGTGQISGVITGKLVKSDFIGKWSSPATGKDLDMKMSFQKVVVIPAPSNSSLQGEYYYRFGKDGPEGTLRCQSAGDDSAIIKIETTTGGPAYNQATVDSTIVRLADGQARLMVGDACRIRIRFFNEFAMVDVDDETGCGFGMNATVSGVYKKIQGNRP